MGSAYFDTLYDVAVQCDAHVFPMAIARFNCGESVRRKLPDPAGVGDFWIGIPFDRIMELSRGLADIDDHFHQSLQELLVVGRVRVTITHPHTGKPFDLRDPDIFTFDEPTMDVEAFHHWMQKYPRPVRGN